MSGELSGAVRTDRFCEDGVGLKIVRNGMIIHPFDENAEKVEAVRQILLRLYHLVDLEVLPDGQIDRVRREAIFFVYEGGEPAKWHAGRSHSQAARALRGGKVKLFKESATYDHAIPLVLLRAGLREASISHQYLAHFLLRNVRGVVITREENLRLNALGLRSKMPADSHPNDLMARYRAAKILFNPEDEALLGLN